MVWSVLSNTRFSDLSLVQDPLEGWLKLGLLSPLQVSFSVGLGPEDLHFCRLSGAADAAGRGTPPSLGNAAPAGVLQWCLRRGLHFSSGVMVTLEYTALVSQASLAGP